MGNRHVPPGSLLSSSPTFRAKNLLYFRCDAEAFKWHFRQPRSCLLAFFVGVARSTLWGQEWGSGIRESLGRHLPHLPHALRSVASVQCVRSRKKKVATGMKSQPFWSGLVVATGSMFLRLGIGVLFYFLPPRKTVVHFRSQLIMRRAAENESAHSGCKSKSRSWVLTLSFSGIWIPGCVCGLLFFQIIENVTLFPSLGVFVTGHRKKRNIKHPPPSLELD